MSKIKQYSMLRLTPLLLLPLLILTPKVGVLIAGTAAHPTIAAIRYFSVPLIGISIGFVVFLWASQRDMSLCRLNIFARRYNIPILLFFSVFFFFLFPACLSLDI